RQRSAKETASTSPTWTPSRPTRKSIRADTAASWVGGSDEGGDGRRCQGSFIAAAPPTVTLGARTSGVSRGRRGPSPAWCRCDDFFREYFRRGRFSSIESPIRRPLGGRDNSRLNDTSERMGHPC